MDRSAGADVPEGIVDLFFASVEAWLSSIGWLAYVVAPVVMALVSILPVPAEAPAMANGMLFGPVLGSVVTWVGGMGGAWISYEIAHRWGRPVAKRFTGENVTTRLEEGAEAAGWWGLLVLRFIPVVAFTALNWGAGLCGVPRGRFLWTTAVGIAPGAVLFTTSGYGLSALWRRSPPAAAAAFVLVVVLTVVWAVRRRQPAAT